ncbi:MAG: hypothetical protein RL154_685, partial [Pseudomonadota bacterium]
KTKNQKPDNIQNIGILINVAIGDTTIATGVIEDIKRDLSNAKITLFVGGSNYEVAKLIQGVDVVKLPVLNLFQSIKILKQYQFDAWLDFGQWARLNAICSFFVNAKFKVGFKTSGQFRHFTYDKSVYHLSTGHEIDNFRALAEEIGVNGIAKPQFYLDKSIEKENCAILHLFAGGSKSYLKEWALENWQQLIKNLLLQFDTIYLSGAAIDNIKIEPIIADFDKSKVISIAGKVDIKQMVEYLQKASLVVSVDTGIMHLASAVNTNLVALHGPTSPNRWGALNKNAISLSANISCAPCLSLGFESKCTEPKCMQSITVESVMAAINALKLQKTSF